MFPHFTKTKLGGGGGGRTQNNHCKIIFLLIYLLINMRVLMCFPAYMDEPWGLCSHLCPGGGRVRGKPDLDHFGKGEKGGRGWLFKSAFNSLAANYSQYVKVNATIKTRDALKFLPDAS